MGIGDAYPFGTMLCRVNYKGEHEVSLYLGFIPFSYIEASTGHVKYVNGGAQVDVIVYMGSRPWGAFSGWAKRETIEGGYYHLWDPATCKPQAL